MIIIHHYRHLSMYQSWGELRRPVYVILIIIIHAFVAYFIKTYLLDESSSRARMVSGFSSSLNSQHLEQCLVCGRSLINIIEIMDKQIHLYLLHQNFYMTYLFSRISGYFTIQSEMPCNHFREQRSLLGFVRKYYKRTKVCLRASRRGAYKVELWSDSAITESIWKALIRKVPLMVLDFWHLSSKPKQR